jgi:Signal transduction histidine kinase regulating C4-dicarboxylate transport system
MHFPRPYSLQGKFLIGLIGTALAIGGILFAVFSYYMSMVLENEVREKASLVLSQVDAVQGYVRGVLRPRMYEKLPDTFIIEAMSTSFISREVMGRITDGQARHIYRRVAIGARNPDFEANELERGMVDRFRADPSLTRWEGYRTVDGVKHFVMARPAVFKESCLRCHGRIEDAPVELVEKYGDRGFGHAVNSIGGIDFVGLPVTASVARIHGAISTYLVVFAMAALFYFVATNVIFKRIVANNIRTLTTSFRRNFSDDRSVALFREVEQGDEIGEMVSGIEKLSDYLYDTRQQLENYAANLEGMVAERTQALANQAAARQADVELFVQLLAGSSRSQSRRELWRATLPLIGKRFDLERVVHLCTISVNRHHSWPESDEPPELPDGWVNLLTDSKPLIEERRAFIPEESSPGNAEGLLCLYQKPGRAFDAQDRTVLMAIGRQLGIASENFMALDSIVRHNSNLQAVFESITEPLMLANSSGSPIVVNEAARRLSLDLSGGVRDNGDIVGLLCGARNEGEDCGISTSIRMDQVLSREVSLPGGRCFALSIYPVRVANPEENGRAVVYVHETTQQKRLLAQMNQAEKMATVGKLASGLAHEINNPLGVILCYAELLRKSQPRGQAADDIEVIVKHTRQAQSVLKNLLNFARPKVATDTAVDVEAVIRSVVDVFHVQAVKQGAVIEVAAEGPVPAVGVDAQAVEHIVANLLLNALDVVAEPGGLVRIGLTHDQEAGDVVLEVVDNGPGIAPDHLQYVFDPFFTTKEVNKGSGLGLAVVFGFMSDLGGSIVADNIPGGGAVFTLRFPVARERGEA